ncbi:MAG: protein kinase, partial [Hyphomicrobium sp.]
MFGRRSNDTSAPKRIAPQPASQSSAPAAATEIKVAQQRQAAVAAPEPRPQPEPVEQQRKHSEEYYDVKTTVFNALIDTIDLTQLAKLDGPAAREEIRDIVSEIIQIK